MGSFVGDPQPSPLCGDTYNDKDFDHILGCTFPFIETAPFDDGLTTQVMNFEDETPLLFKDGLETPIMNFEEETQVLFEDGLETQVIDFVDETQVLDDFDGFENLDIQLLDEWNNEETDKTDGEESEKTNKLCDIEDSDKLVCSSQDLENTTISKKDDKPNEAELDASFFNQTSAGVKLDFTSIRVAALRASGLAARKKTPSNEITEFCLSISEDKSPKGNPTLKGSNAISIRTPLIHSLENNESPLEEEKVNERIEETKIGNSAVRQLSICDVEVVENEGHNGSDLYKVKDVGLNYVDSQEPGELSQANALEFVDKLIKSSDTNFTKAFDTVGSTAEKSKSVSCIRGIQNLARRNGLKCMYDENGIYDWDDNLEDEGGGEFFSRKKMIFFDEEENCLPSKMRSSKRTAKRAKIEEVKKNLPKELDEKLNVNSQDGAKATSSKKHLQHIRNVKTDSEQTHVGSIGERENGKFPHKYSLRKRCGPSSCDDLIRKLKQQKISCTNLNREVTVASLKQFKSMRKQHEEFDTFDAVSPSSRRGQVRSCAPIASRTRQSIGKNITFDTSIDMSCGKRRKSRGRLSDNGKQPVKQCVGQHRIEKSCEISNQSKRNLGSFSADQGIKRFTRSSLRVNTAFPSLYKESERDFCKESGDEEELKEGICKFMERDLLKLDVSPRERSKLSVLTSSSPASPICMGDEYVTPSCRKNLSKQLIKKIARKVSYGVEPFIWEKPMKNKDMSNVRVIFSHHLDDDIIKYQKKIVAKLGSSVAPSIKEATHFVADKFVRTRNMLEAIALGKPVVTHHWLERCEQASCCIDERSHILRDAKKEREFGFSLPASLAHASQHPLLQGLKVWITPNTRPGLEILSSLVKAVHGLPVKRIGRSVLKDEKVPDDLIVLSCKEDYAACLPFIEKGGVVFSSELLLDGIVSQNLDYERHRLFDDHVKKTRSTIWLKQNSNQYLRVAKCK